VEHRRARCRRRTGPISVKDAYSYGEAKNTVDPGSIAFGSWNNNQHAGDPNNPGLGYARSARRGTACSAVSYRASTSASARRRSPPSGRAGRFAGNTSYVFAGDLNGDGGTSNDLIYIHRDVSEMNFPVHRGGRTFTAAEQAQAWNAFIEQDKYLSQHRGQYAQRGAVFLPFIHRGPEHRAGRVPEHRGPAQLAPDQADILNFGNLLNSDWGVGQRLVTNQPLTNPGCRRAGAGDVPAAGHQQRADEQVARADHVPRATSTGCR
jgi:hypothetical protein